MFTDGRQQRQPNHNTTTYCVYWRTTTTINPIIIRPHCMFTNRRQQWQPNHNTTTYCVYGRTKTTINTIIIRPHCMFTDRRQQRQPNQICGRIMIGLSLLSSVSKHTMWSYYDWVYCCCRPSVNTICGRIMIGLSLSSVSIHNMWSCNDKVVVVVFRQLIQHVVILWLGCRCCRPSVNTICGRIMIGLSLSSVSKHNMWSYWTTTTTQS
jgi:hypothetical protein